MLIFSLGQDLNFTTRSFSLFRYSLSNQLRAGFFGQDACVQTDESELPNIKTLAADTADLMKVCTFMNGPLLS